MLKHKSKGQSLVEFALILPILLMLLLGIFEIGRVIWAYITVQSAARDAARYAITGKPYIVNPQENFTDNPDCLKVEGEANATKPWRCSPKTRAEAIKRLAIERSYALIGGIPPKTDPPYNLCEGLSNPTSCICEYPTGSTEDYTKWNCKVQDPNAENFGNYIPNAFGVVVVGQVITKTANGSTPINSVPNYAGEQGLNVAVYTFYNVQMVTPIFNAIVGGLPVTVRGEVQMQNEGQNEVLAQTGGVPINVQPPVTGPGTQSCPAPQICGPEGQAIKSDNYAFRFGTDTEINIELINHDQSQLYDIYLESRAIDKTAYKICSNVQTDGNNHFISPPPCDLTGLKPGSYCLYSVGAGTTGQTCENPLASAEQDVIISADDDTITNTLVILDASGTSPVWARHTPIKAELQKHAPGDYMVFAIGNGFTTPLVNFPLTVDSNGFASTAPMARLAPATDEDNIPPSPCPPGGVITCVVRSVVSSDNSTAADAPFFMTNPSIKLFATGNITYQKGDTIQVQLIDHTPKRSYFVVVFSGTQILASVSENAKTDENGTSGIVSIHLTDEGENVWENGTYSIRSYPSKPSATDLETTWIAPRKQFTVDNSNVCYLTIVGVSKDNYKFPIGSLITIQMNNHAAGDYFLQFGDSRIPTSRADNTLLVGPSGIAKQGFIIPMDAASSTSVKYQISSFSTSVTDNPARLNQACATIQVEILPKPYIEVYQGNTRMDAPDAILGIPSTYPPITQAVLPDATIGIRLRNHAPNTSYRLSYAGQLMPNVIAQTDGSGSFNLNYDLTSLPKDPPGSDITDSKNWGIPLDMISRQYNDNQRIATTTLTIRSGDLWAKDATPRPVEVVHTSANPHINRPYTVTFTVENAATIPISRYFDIDMYQDPAPLIPGQLQNKAVFNMPGDFKQWRMTPLANGQSFQLQQAFTLTRYGLQTFYAYANTSRLVNEATESNNVISTTVNLTCNESSIAISPETFGLGTQTEEILPVITFESPYDVDAGGANASDWQGKQQQNNGGRYTTFQGQLMLTHGAGRPDAVDGNDRVYALYYNKPITRFASAQISVVQAPSSNGQPYGVGNYVSGWAGLEVRVASPESNAFSYDKRIYFALKWKEADNNYQLVAGGRVAANNNQIPEVSPISQRILLSQLPISLKIEVDKQQKLHFKYGTNGQDATTEITSYADTLNPVSFTPDEAQKLYVTLFASNGEFNGNYYTNNASETIFDNFKTTVWSEGGKFSSTKWTAQPYGGRTADPLLGVDTAALILKNLGADNLGSRNDNNGGYFFYRYNTASAISTKFDFDAVVGMHNLTGGSEKAMAGLEIRRKADPSSAKIQFGLMKQSNGSYLPQVINRDTYNGQATLWESNGTGYTLPNYVWLGITRNQITGGFKFYHAQTNSSTPPASWTEYSANELLVSTNSALEPIEDEIEIGLFNDSHNASIVQSTEFVYFKFGFRPCEPGKGSGEFIKSGSTTIPTNIPPGYEYCPNPLQDTGLSFEKPGVYSVWNLGGNAFVANGGAYDGNYKMGGWTDNQSTPYFYQKLTLESSPPVSTAATVKFSIWYDIDDNGKPEPASIFQVALVTKAPTGTYPDPTSDELLSEPATIAVGTMNQVSYSGPSWEQKNMELTLKPGVNLNSYSGDVYLLVYNNSNTRDCALFSSCRNIKFNFDELNLEICRTQPKPTDQELIDVGKDPTHIQGTVRVDEGKGDGAIRKEGVKVWAYAEGGKLYETTTIQGGEYNFYGLPASTNSNTKYFLYTEYAADNGNGTSSMLVDDTTVLLKNDGLDRTGVNLTMIRVGVVNN